jgi:pimeloyl-ACP methyl ester carboxylesterase
MIDLQYLPAGRQGRPAGLLVLPPVPPRRLLICVHGFTRQPLEQAAAFAPLARERGWALLLPVFDDRRHRRYAQLSSASDARRLRADQALIDLVERVRRSHPLPQDGWGLFGFSAGAQFAHRFALLHPQRLGALALGAAGWYTWPQTGRPWPQGLDDAPEPPQTEAFLRLPMALWVGERDVVADRHLRDDEELNLWQGPHRMLRAQAWSAAVADARAGLGLLPPVLHTIPRAGHSFPACDRRGALAAAVVDFIAGSAPACDGLTNIS